MRSDLLITLYSLGDALAKDASSLLHTIYRKEKNHTYICSTSSSRTPYLLILVVRL